MLGSTAIFRASRLVQGGLTRSLRVSDSNNDLAATAGVGAAIVLLVFAASPIRTRPSVDDSPSLASIGEKIKRIHLLNCSVFSSLCPPFLQAKRAQCESPCVHYTENFDQDLDDDSGYTEAERFWQCLDYHRSLLHDYNRRWGPQVGGDAETSSCTTINTVANQSAQWPRNIPTAKEVSALECDLRFCERSPNYHDHIRICQDTKFRIAAFYATQNDEESQRQGFRVVKELAEQGHPDGMCYYGILLNEGNIAGVDANPQQAVVWWRRCVDEHRHIKATYELATACYLGEGVPENPEMAVPLFRRAAHLGHAGAAYMLGECLLNGVGAERDRANALEWLVTAAELGHRGARDRVLMVLNEDYSNLDAGEAAEERKQEEAVKWMNISDEAKLKVVNIERRYTIGGGSRNPAVRARRKTIVAESRDES